MFGLVSSGSVTVLSNAFRPAVGSVRGMQRLSGEGCIALNGELRASPRWGLWGPCRRQGRNETSGRLLRWNGTALTRSRRIREPATPVREMSIELELEL